VNLDTLPSVHQDEFSSYVERYFEGTAQKRAYTEDHREGFFQLKSVVSLSMDGERGEHDFVLKPAHFSPEVKHNVTAFLTVYQVHSDFVPVDVELAHMFNGYAKDNLGTIIVLTVPRSGTTEGHRMDGITGMVHHADGTFLCHFVGF
jgi:hypothetical protein